MTTIADLTEDQVWQVVGPSAVITAAGAIALVANEATPEVDDLAGLADWPAEPRERFLSLMVQYLDDIQLYLNRTRAALAIHTTPLGAERVGSDTSYL